MALPSFVVSLVWLLGLVLVYTAQVIVGPGSAQGAIAVVGVLVAVAGVALRGFRAFSEKAERRQVEQALLGLGVVALAALAIYFAQSDVMVKWSGSALSQSSPKLAVVLAVLWPVLMATSLITTWLMELSYAAMARAPQVETGRVRDAMMTGLGLTCAIVFAFALMYVAEERNAKVDLSYFRTAKPGDATVKMVRALDKPVEIALFYPPANDVAEELKSYLDPLAAESPMFQVKVYDQALEPAKAKEFGISGNGVLVVRRDANREPLQVGVELEKARGKLRNLDSDFQKALMRVARSTRTIYFTTGHGERGEDNTVLGDQRTTARFIRERLRALNYEPRALSAADGLASEIPKDAAAVLVIGPTSPFSQAEADTLKAYVARGGRVFYALDPEVGHDFQELVEPLGLSFTPKMLANDEAYARRDMQVSDRAIIGTNTFSSHPSVTNLSRSGYPMYLMKAGAVEELPQHPAELIVDASVRAHPKTWVDGNANFGFDPDESRRAYGVAAAVTRRAESLKTEEEGRAIVLGDSDAVADEVLQVSLGNVLYMADAVKWLSGDEAISGVTNTEVDAPIRLTGKQSSALFYSTIFAVPVLVVALGLVASRKKRSSRKRAPQAAAREAQS